MKNEVKHTAHTAYALTTYLHITESLLRNASQENIPIGMIDAVV